MKILFTANRFPYPPFRGDKLKIFHLAKRLSKDHELHLLTFLENKDDLKHLKELKVIFKEIHLVDLPKPKSLWNSFLGIFKKKPIQVQYFYSKKMQEKVHELSKEGFDVVHVQHIRMAQYWAKIQNVPRILDLPDAYSLYWKRRLNNKKGMDKWFAEIEYKRILKYEDILNEYDLSLVCSKEDQQYLQQEKGIDNVKVLPNGVDLSTFSVHQHDYQQDDIILFTGNMNYAPNVDAVIYFAREIFPIILKKNPNIRFVIAGQSPLKSVLELANENIEVTGFIKDLSTVYKKAAVVVAPLRFGAGTQNKVLEAMAMGVPVVSRNIGFNGLNIKNGEGVFLELETDGFANKVIKLLQDEELRKITGQKGKQIIKEQFDWDVIAKYLEEYLLQVKR